MLRIKGPGVFLKTALISMASATLILGFLNPGARVSLLIALGVSGTLVTGGYWIVRRLQEKHG